MMGTNQDLQSPDEWNLEAAERKPGKKSGRVIVSVAFQRPDFESISECAEQTGKKVSEFIRDASIEKAARHQAQSNVSAFSGTGGAIVFTRHTLPASRSPQTTHTTHGEGSVTMRETVTA